MLKILHEEVNMQVFLKVFQKGFLFLLCSAALFLVFLVPLFPLSAGLVAFLHLQYSWKLVRWYSTETSVGLKINVAFICSLFCAGLESITLGVLLLAALVSEGKYVWCFDGKGSWMVQAPS